MHFAGSCLKGILILALSGLKDLIIKAKDKLFSRLKIYYSKEKVEPEKTTAEMYQATME
jgi:hypothetical protein